MSTVSVLLSLQLKNVSMVKAKVRMSEVTGHRCVFPQAELVEAVTRPTAPGVRDLKAECPWEERKEFHRKACFCVFARQPAFLMLLAEHEH